MRNQCTVFFFFTFIVPELVGCGGAIKASSVQHTLLPLENGKCVASPLAAMHACPQGSTLSTDPYLMGSWQGVKFLGQPGELEYLTCLGKNQAGIIRRVGQSRVYDAENNSVLYEIIFDPQGNVVDNEETYYQYTHAMISLMQRSGIKLDSACGGARIKTRNDGIFTRFMMPCLGLGI